METNRILYNNGETFKTLSPKKQRECFDAYAAGDEKMGEVLLEHNLALVAKVINKHYNGYNDKEELFQVGCLALWKAIKNYQISYGTSFSTYAYTMIRGDMRHFIQRNRLLFVPAVIYDLSNKIFQENKRRAKLGLEELSIKELAIKLNASMEDIILAKRAYEDPISLSGPLAVDVESGDELHLENILKNPEDTISTRIEQEELRQGLKAVLKNLDEDKKILIEYYFGLNGVTKTQTELAAMYGLCQPYVSVIIKKTLKKLRTLCQENPLIVETVKKERQSSPIKKVNLLDDFPGYTTEQLMQAIEMLSDNNQMALELRYGLNGHLQKNTKELAEILKIRPHSVFLKMERIKERLAQKLDQLETEPEKRTITNQDHLLDNKQSIETTIQLEEILKILAITGDRDQKRAQLMTIINRLENSVEQQILLLRLGCVDDRYYTKKQVSLLLKLPEEEIAILEQKGLSNMIDANTKIEEKKIKTYVLR